MAPRRGSRAPRRPHQAHRLPRDHQARHPRGHRAPPDRQHGPGKRPAGTAHPRPARRFRALARAVEKGASVALGRTRAVGRRAADRRARARDHRLPPESLFPRRRAVPHHRRRGEDPLQGRDPHALRNRRRGRGFPWQLHRRDLHRGPRGEEARAALPRSAVHHLDAPAGGRAQTRHVGLADDVRGAAPLRAGSDHLHAYRLGEPLAAGPGPVQGGGRNIRAGSTTRPRPRGRRRHTKPSARRTSTGSRSRVRLPKNASTN